MARTRSPMKNRQKSRSGCRTCKLRRLRCDETKPGCRNCTQKGFECPGYQQRLQWSTKHERSVSVKAPAPDNFHQLVSAASESIVQSVQSSSTTEKPKTQAPGGSSSSKTSLDTPLISTSTRPPVRTNRRAKVIAPLSPPKSPGQDQCPPPSTALVLPVSASNSHGIIQQTASDQPPLTLWQPMVDIPSFLIEHWFNTVCGSWSAFDSHANPYRRLTSILWSTSTPVFHALQAISAASLVEKLPHVIRETARAAPHLATDAIMKELHGFFSASYPPAFPSGLLLSLFCMSSSMCWMEARHLGLLYVRQARAVLKRLDRWSLGEQEQELFDFFNGCLIYEEMLRSVVSDEEVDFENMLSWPEPPVQGPIVPAIPHAWTGVSSGVLRLFGKAMALCRRSRNRWRRNHGTSFRVIQDAVKDIEEATLVEEALLAIEVTDEGSQSLLPHLRDTTEAYRLSSLLQLYETFPDLITRRIPTLADADESEVWHAWVLPLALHITSILERIPAGSMRCIQPLLCLCAGTGLKFSTRVPLGGGSQSYVLSTNNSDVASNPTTPDSAVDPSLALDIGITEMAIRTSQARRFLMSRLDMLEITLPPKPIGVAKQLLRAVWSTYDGEIGTAQRTHWLDVMSFTGLHSLFG